MTQLLSGNKNLPKITFKRILSDRNSEHKGDVDAAHCRKDMLKCRASNFEASPKVFSDRLWSIKAVRTMPRDLPTQQLVWMFPGDPAVSVVVPRKMHCAAWTIMFRPLFQGALHEENVICRLVQDVLIPSVVTKFVHPRISVSAVQQILHYYIM